jgi:hypothetical protein
VLYAVIALLVTNLGTVGALVYLWLRPPPQPRPDARLGEALDRTLARSVTATGTRRVISVEILNIVELARTRGRLAAFAGSLVPGLTARIVYDQTIKTMRRQLEVEHVVADVRMHTLARIDAHPAPGGRVEAGGRVDAGSRVDASTTDRVEATTANGLADVEDPRDASGSTEA